MGDAIKHDNGYCVTFYVITPRKDAAPGEGEYYWQKANQTHFGTYMHVSSVLFSLTSTYMLAPDVLPRPSVTVKDKVKSVGPEFA